MKHLDEYRDGEAARKLAAAIARAATRPWTIMEVCGGQTHSIVKYGIDQVLPPGLELVHGPGCPVCVTPLETIDRAHAIASRPGVIFCSFGDMLRVPGSRGDLLQLKSQGADVRIVYSPLDAVNLAAANPDRKVVFFAIGFETTAPPNAMAVWMARKRKLSNFSVLVSHVLVPPAIAAILEAPDNRVQGFLGPGHVCTVVGYEEYEPLVDRYRRADRDHGLRAGQPARGGPARRPAARGGPRRGRERLRPGRPPRGQSPVAATDRGRLRGLRPQVAGRGPDPRRADCSSAPSTATTTPSGCSTSTTSRPRSRRSASAARSSGDSRSRTTARRSAGSAPRILPWARRWSRPKGPVPPITPTAGTSRLLATS